MKTGIKTITLTDEDLAALYEGRYDADTYANQYLFVHNVNGELVDKLRWDGEQFVPIKFRTIEGYRLGKVKPLNEEQQALFDLLQNEGITVKKITGKAGSGKNYCALAYALDAVDKFERCKSQYRKIILVRNNVEVKHSVPLGALPNGINEKLLPFAMPAADILGNKTELFRMLDDEKIEILHLGFARGRSFENAIIIVDESENLTREHVALLVSRVGKNSVIMFLGDSAQVDKEIFEKSSGLDALTECLAGNKLFGEVHLIKTERSETAALAELLM